MAAPPQDRPAAAPPPRYRPTTARPQDERRAAAPRRDARPTAARSHARPTARPAPDKPPRRRRTAVLAGIAVGVLLGVAVVVTASSGGSEGSRAGTGTRPSTISLQPAAAALGTAARGVVTTDAHGREQLVLRDLPGGRYTVWLYDSIVDAEPVGSLVGPEGTVTLPARGDLRRHRFLDVSHEDDTNPNHSGQSILRLSTASVR